MEKQILVAYASAAGSTGGVAEIIGDALAGQGAAVDVRPVQTVEGVEEYRAVVLGSAIHGGKWLPEAVGFLETHQAALRQAPVAFFLVCLMAARYPELVSGYLEDERSIVPPLAEGRFMGAMFPGKYPLGTNLGMRCFLAYLGLGLRGGDFRQAGCIREWAVGIYPLLGRG
ncbi:MAG: flavodoxin domain-containing protein [Anaerolineaceae bacterium]|nr:flavodoxin domain-containing protein [Anaerolineaceae bacterium]